MNFNLDPTKQEWELIFSRKVQMTETLVLQSSLQRHLGMLIDSKLNFSEYLKTIFQKTNKTIGLLRILQTLLPRAPLIIIIYKSFIRSHLDCVDMIYDQTFSMSFQLKLETIQYNACFNNNWEEQIRMED